MGLSTDSDCIEELGSLRSELADLRQRVLDACENRLKPFAPYFPGAAYTPSAINLAHYLCLRQHDLRPLQERLAAHGLSSLGRSEAHVLDTLDRMLDLLAHRVASEVAAAPAAGPRATAPVSYLQGLERLRTNTDAIFGPAPNGRRVRVMVTLPSEAADEPKLVRRLLEAGMDCARINCAHDDTDAWAAMVAHIREAERGTGRACRVSMDLAGHKIRTGAIQKKPKREPELDAAVYVEAGEAILLVRDPRRRERAVRAGDADERWVPRIACTCPRVFDFLRVGDAVWIDDGKLGGHIESVDDEGARVHLSHVPPGGAKIKADKGLNFPDTALDLPPLSERDLSALDFVTRCADMVGYSFVQSLEDMSLLIDELEARNAASLPIIAKIETRRAVQHLPEILLGTLGRHPLGVMIARGDLAVELGGERMAEIQEELLWICEAAHVPVIWATQVLESLAKRGIASRPELTDAAMSERAECVMLNKGPYIVQAVRTLIDILRRMEAHQHKKHARLRALHW